MLTLCIATLIGMLTGSVAALIAGNIITRRAIKQEAINTKKFGRMPGKNVTTFKGRR
jgi:cellobiose-specific phosphotransferase system component IIB